LTAVVPYATRGIMSASSLTSGRGAAIGLDHVGIVGADLDGLAEAFSALGFHLTPFATHASGRTGNRCIMLRDGGYLELMATVPGQSSATLDRFLAVGQGAHILALEVADEAAALERLRRADVAQGDVSFTERNAGTDGEKAKFALVTRDIPEGRVLLIRHLTRGRLWRNDNTLHPNHATALTEIVFSTDTPGETMTRLSVVSGRPAEPDPLGGYRIIFGHGRVRILPRAAAALLFPGTGATPPLIGLTIAAQNAASRLVHAGGVAIRFIARSG
jgi:hypothetical protein